MKKAVIIISSVLVISLLGNVYLFYMNLRSGAFGAPLFSIHFSDANTRETYNTVHRLKEAHQLRTGKGIKVGILDWGFAYDDYPDLYAGGVDLMELSYHVSNYHHAAEHGLWMAETLREVAPDAQIYAIGTYDRDEKTRVGLLIKGIDWAIENGINILTLSHRPIEEAFRPEFDKAVAKAVDKGIVTTFIHYDSPLNILPFPIDSCGEYNRQPDINILQHDFNTILLDNYRKYLEKKDYSYKDYVYYSISSTSPVTAGIVALMMETDSSLTPAQYKQILIDSSRPFTYEGKTSPHVADALSAIQMTADFGERY